MSKTRTSVESELKRATSVFKKISVQLTDELPIDDFLPIFYSDGLLSAQVKSRIETMPLSTPQKKTQYFLAEMIQQGLRIGLIDPFMKMIRIMESRGDPASKSLAKKIRTELSSLRLVSDSRGTIHSVAS